MKMKRNTQPVSISGSGSVGSQQKGHGHTALSVLCCVTATLGSGWLLETKEMMGVAKGEI